MRRASLAVLLLLVTACATTQPGTFGAADQDIYNGLIVLQAALNTAASTFGSDPAAKAPLDKAIASYNALKDAYLAYHSAIASGGKPDSTAISAQLAQLIADVAALERQFGGK